MTTNSAVNRNLLLSMTLKVKSKYKWFFQNYEWKFLILMQLQDFNFIKHRGKENCFCFCLSKKITDICESNHWELFGKKDVLRCFWLGIWGVLDSKKTGRTNKMRCSVKKLPFWVGYWRVLDYIRRTNSKHPGKLGILVKIYIFSTDNTMVFLCDICLFPEKNDAFLFLSLTNSYLNLSGTFSCSVR